MNRKPKDALIHHLRRSTRPGQQAGSRRPVLVLVLPEPVVELHGAAVELLRRPVVAPVTFLQRGDQRGSLLHRHLPHLQLMYGRSSVYNISVKFRLHWRSGYIYVPCLGWSRRCSRCTAALSATRRTGSTCWRAAAATTGSRLRRGSERLSLHCRPPHTAQIAYPVSAIHTFRNRGPNISHTQKGQ